PDSCPAGFNGPNIGLNGPLGVTFATWVKPDDGFCPSNTDHVLFQTPGELGAALKCKTDNTIGLEVQFGYNYYNPIGTIPVGQWSHVALVLYARSYYVVYVNGIYAGSSWTPQTDLGHVSWWYSLGCGAAATMDEAALWRRPLSPQEVAALYQSPTLCNVHPR